MGEHFYHRSKRRAVHFATGEFDDLATALSACVRSEPASAARDAVAAFVDGDLPRRGAFDLEDLPAVFAVPGTLHVFAGLVATFASDLARPLAESSTRMDPWDADRQASWLARLSDLYDALRAAATTRGVAVEALSLDLPAALAQAVSVLRLTAELEDLHRAHRRAPWDGTPGEVRRAASALIEAALASPGFAAARERLLYAYQQLAESCEALGDDASAADAWRRAAQHAPQGPYRTSLLDCADEVALPRS